MRIIRFLNDAGETCHGHDEHDGTAELLEGRLLGGKVKPTGKRAVVMKRLAPVDPRVILCIGLNYRQHAAETGAAIPQWPVLFMKNPSTAIGPSEAIVLPKICMDPPEVDYECELAVVIGRAAKNVSEAEALKHVAGYMIANDVSARLWQKDRGGSQWCRGKGFDTFCPMGPALVTPDEVPDPQKLQLTTTLNGQVMQDSNTSDMIFTVAQLIAFLSSGVTLLPGTVILTGTPSGVGMARSPQVFLQDGDKLELSITSLGTLVNPIKAE
ncbi:fumarylacetoacetate hydrolase family protein [Planctomycetales bacterium ZRK34]|nr:fumarylacetoacetate hydrolase family protein [Planctomycetales bacterium ZRK34]